MKIKVRYLYDGSWTQWYNYQELPDEFKNLKLEAIEISELMTKEEYEKYISEVIK